MEEKFRYGGRLWQLRAQVRLSQESVALAAGITTSYYGQIERGTANPTVETLERICDALGVSVNDVFTGLETEPLRTDKTSGQILRILNGKTEKEKELILSIVKAAAKLCEQRSE